MATGDRLSRCYSRDTLYLSRPPSSTKLKHTIRTWLIALLAWTSVAFAGDCSYRNPVLLGEFPDPSVIRVGQDYYATATETGWEPIFSIAHSTDLIHWRVVGAVFENPPAWSSSSYWAPELVHYRD